MVEVGDVQNSLPSWGEGVIAYADGVVVGSGLCTIHSHHEERE
jgi:hypothetical protein